MLVIIVTRKITFINNNKKMQILVKILEHIATNNIWIEFWRDVQELNFAMKLTPLKLNLIYLEILNYQVTAWKSNETTWFIALSCKLTITHTIILFLLSSDRIRYFAKLHYNSSNSYFKVNPAIRFSKLRKLD